MRQYLPWIVSGVLAAVVVFLLFRRPDVISPEIKAKDVQIAQLSKDRDSLKMALQRYQKANNQQAARDSIKWFKAHEDTLNRSLKASQKTIYALAHQVKQAQLLLDQPTLDSACPELAEKVLIDSQVIAQIQDIHQQGIKTYDAVIGVKDSVISQQAHIIAVDDTLIKSQQDKAALQSALLKKVRKQSTFRAIVAGVASGLAVAGWLIIAVK